MATYSILFCVVLESFCWQVGDSIKKNEDNWPVKQQYQKEG
jgi:hypothetical protein